MKGNRAYQTMYSKYKATKMVNGSSHFGLFIANNSGYRNGQKSTIANGNNHHSVCVCVCSYGMALLSHKYLCVIVVHEL